jgi:hypothetical protein
MATSAGRQRLMFAAAVAVLAAIGFAAALALSAGAATAGAFRVVSVEVTSATSADVTFNNVLAPSATDTSRPQFFGDHLDWVQPHIHGASDVKLMNGGRTARLVLRALHSEDPPCEGPEPRCSDDRIPLVVSGVSDVDGNLAYDDEWEVWAVGARK